MLCAFETLLAAQGASCELREPEMPRLESSASGWQRREQGSMLVCLNALQHTFFKVRAAAFSALTALRFCFGLWRAACHVRLLG